MPRQTRLDFPGTLHHAICRGIERREIVSDDNDRENFVLRLGVVAAETGTTIYAWALMTNHAHILLRSGPHGISAFMRKLLTGYAISYNRRHERNGYLFQNRYKSIVCDEEAYFLELVRYIHLNPLRVGLAPSLHDLDQYPYCGHGVLMGKIKNEWQDRDFVLRQFGDTEKGAQREYRKFIGVEAGNDRRPELVGGELIRSRGGWSEVISQRRQKNNHPADGRVLGDDKFLGKLVEDAEERQRKRFSISENKTIIGQIIEAECLREGASVRELKSGGRRANLSQIRLQIARTLVEDYGIPMAMVAHEVGVTTAAISKGMKALKNRS